MNTILRVPRASRVRELILHRSLASTGHVSAYSRRQLRDLERRWVTRNWRLISVVLGGSAIAAIVAAIMVPTALGEVLAGAFLASGWWWLHMVMVETTGASSHRLGLLGETWTSIELSVMRRRGWQHVNDLALDRGQADHIAVGPGGVLVVESKYRNDWARASAELAGMAGQVSSEMERMASFLKMRGKTRAIVAMWGNGLDDLMGDSWFELDGVVFCRGTSLSLYLDSLPFELEIDEIRRAHGQLVELVRRRDDHDDREVGPVPMPWSERLAEVCLQLSLALATLMFLFVPLAWWGLWWGLGAGVSIAFSAATLHGRLSSRRGRARLAVVAAVATWSVAALGAAVLVDLLFH